MGENEFVVVVGIAVLITLYFLSLLFREDVHQKVIDLYSSEPPKESDEDFRSRLEKMTKAEIEELGLEMGVNLNSRRTKTTMINELMERR